MTIEVEKNSLKKVQKAQLEILIEFDRICRKSNLRYQLFSGTLLGAVRHNGVIPWDDDIDVCLLREDYEKFLKVCDKELNSLFFLQTFETDPEYIMQFAKIRKNNTLFVEKATSDCEIHQGIYIDIFPLDNVEQKKIMGRIHYMILFFIGRLNLCRIKMHCLSAKTPSKRFFSLLGYYFSKIVPKKINDNIQKKMYCLFSNKKTKYVSHLTNGVSKKRLKMFLRDKESFNKIVLSEFDGYEFPIPVNHHEVLTKHYGNYMELPPKEKRISHHGIIKIKANE